MARDAFQAQLEELIGDDTPEDHTPISEVPSLEPVVYEEKDSKNVAEIGNEDLKEDYQFARSNLYGLIGKNNAAIDLLLKIANMTESTRSLDIASDLIKSSSDLTEKLIALQKALEVKGDGGKGSSAKPGEPSKQTQNNFYFNSSKEELEGVHKILNNLDDEEDNDE